MFVQYDRRLQLYQLYQRDIGGCLKVQREKKEVELVDLGVGEKIGKIDAECGFWEKKKVVNAVEY